MSAYRLEKYILTHDALFWTLLALVTGFLLYPLWIGALPPLQDFGGHVAMADIWVRHDDSELLQKHFILRDDLSPNVLHVRFASLLYPWVDTITSLRLWMTLSLAGLMGAVVYGLKVFGRSRWLIFLAAPFVCWGNMTTLGLVNNVAIFPMMFVSLALVRRIGQEPPLQNTSLQKLWPYAVGLGAAQVGAYLAHGISYAFAFGMAAGMLVLSAKTRRTWIWGSAALAPGFLLWSAWVLGTEGRSDMPGAGFFGALKAPGTRIISHEDALIMFVRESIELTTVPARGTIFVVSWAAWFLLIWLLPKAEHTPQQTTRAPTPLKNTLQKLWQSAQTEPLLPLALCVTIGLFVLPYSLMRVPISVRLVTVAALCWLMLPRLRPGSKWAALPAVVGVAMSLWFAQIAASAANTLDRQEWQPLTALLTHISPSDQVACMGTRWAQPAQFFRQPLGHNCYGLVQHVTGAFTDIPFAHTDYNPVRFTNHGPPPDIDGTDWQTNEPALQWDVLIVRAEHSPPPAARWTFIAQTQSPDGGPTWTLYRRTNPNRPPPGLTP